MQHYTNITRLKAVSNALNPLNKDVVFVGGAVLSLYADKPIIDVRNTNDIDVIIEVLSYTHRTRVEDRLRAIGFHHDVESGIVCRYKIQGLIVDIMPTNDPSIGFHNIWYADAFAHSIPVDLDGMTTIKIPTAPYYIATKIEAFKSRGKYDGYSSHDFEDIIFILQNRTDIWKEMETSDTKLKQYLLKSFQDLLNQTLIFDWIEGNIDHSLEIGGTQRILKAIEAFTKR